MRWPIMFSFLLFLGCSASKKMGNKISEIEELTNWMIGSYDSSEQAASDSSYYNISLHMYRIWPERPGNWLYVEQAMATKQAAPYRQRVYELKALEDGIIVSKVYKVPNENECVGKWKTPEYFERYTFAVLEERVGCGVYLRKNGITYSGSTKERECGSTLRGASYATSIVSVFEDQIGSWDQGYDEEGKQVWGAENGPYIFKKVR